jgi:NAD(P)-dependent dehydrogenase (short-subunit alcohol dehydrogenase family)
MDYIELGIRANVICPGMFWTGLGKGARGTIGQQPRSGSYPPPLNVPMNRWAVASEIANATLILAGDESFFIMGVAPPVDGGFVCL